MIWWGKYHYSPGCVELFSLGIKPKERCFRESLLSGQLPIKLNCYMKQRDANTSNILALERTKLANERTFLAYLRTFIVFLSSGFAIIKIDELDSISTLGYFFIGIAVILLIFGTYRFVHVRNRVRSYLPHDATR